LGSYIGKLGFFLKQALAGFSPEQSSYFIERGMLVPSQAMLQSIFPELEASFDKMMDNVKGTEIAGQSFMELLDHFRIVILQDAALKMKMGEFKDHLLFENEE
jgi:hypothetical protein